MEGSVADLGQLRILPLFLSLKKVYHTETLETIIVIFLVTRFFFFFFFFFFFASIYFTRMARQLIEADVKASPWDKGSKEPCPRTQRSVRVSNKIY